MSEIFKIIAGGKPTSDAADDLYHGIHALIDDIPASPVSMLGVLESIKHDILRSCMEDV